MSAPVLNRLLALEGAVRTADGAGGFVLEWAEAGRLWAQLSAGSGRERAGEGLTLSQVTWRITVRAAPPGSPRRPRPEQRFREGERVFRILSVAERDLRGMYLDCMAIEEAVA